MKNMLITLGFGTFVSLLIYTILSFILAGEFLIPSPGAIMESSSTTTTESYRSPEHSYRVSSAMVASSDLSLPTIKWEVWNVSPGLRERVSEAFRDLSRYETGLVKKHFAIRELEMGLTSLEADYQTEFWATVMDTSRHIFVTGTFKKSWFESSPLVYTAAEFQTPKLIIEAHSKPDASLRSVTIKKVMRSDSLDQAEGQPVYFVDFIATYDEGAVNGLLPISVWKYAKSESKVNFGIAPLGSG